MYDTINFNQFELKLVELLIVYPPVVVFVLLAFLTLTFSTIKQTYINVVIWLITTVKVLLI